jgi:hypothetical protein
MLAYHRSSLRRFVTPAVLLLALVLAISPAAAQETDTYEGEFFPFTLTYNSDVWGSRSTSSFEEQERVQLVAGASVFFLQAFPAGNDDASDCIANALESVQNARQVENFEETDELPMADGPRRAEEALMTYELVLAGREEPVAFVQYIACMEMDGGDSLLLVGIETRAGIYEEELEIINGILAGVEYER